VTNTLNLTVSLVVNLHISFVGPRLIRTIFLKSGGVRYTTGRNFSWYPHGKWQCCEEFDESSKGYFVGAAEPSAHSRILKTRAERVVGTPCQLWVHLKLGFIDEWWTIGLIGEPCFGRHMETQIWCGYAVAHSAGSRPVQSEVLPMGTWIEQQCIGGVGWEWGSDRPSGEPVKTRSSLGLAHVQIPGHQMNHQMWEYSGDIRWGIATVRLSRSFSQSCDTLSWCRFEECQEFFPPRIERKIGTKE